MFRSTCFSVDASVHTDSSDVRGCPEVCDDQTNAQGIPQVHPQAQDPQTVCGITGSIWHMFCHSQQSPVQHDSGQEVHLPQTWRPLESGGARGRATRGQRLHRENLFAQDERTPSLRSTSEKDAYLTDYFENSHYSYYHIT